MDELTAWAADGNEFTENRGCNIHNQHDDEAPGKPRRDTSEGCTVILWQFDHACFMELGRLQSEHRGSETFSVTFCGKDELP